MNAIRTFVQKIRRSLKDTAQEIGAMESGKKAAPADGGKGREIATVIAGFVLLALAILGVVLSAVLISRAAADARKADLDRQIAVYADRIAPVVLFDAGEFVNTETANNLSLLIPAYLKARETENQIRAVTATDAYGPNRLPASAVEEAAQDLFGCRVICQTFTLDGLMFEFSENERCFLSPLTAQIGMYTPSIRSLTETADGAELVVDYVEVGSAHEVSKTVRMTLTGKGNAAVITSITALPDE